VKAYIVTQGPRGSQIFAGDKLHEIPPGRERRIVDPTGCGDAYRAGLIFGLARSLDWETTGRIASLMGTIKIEYPGTQNQKFTYAEFADEFKQQFGYALD